MATISTPITRKDLENGVEPTDFTLQKPQREGHKFWEAGLATPIDIERLLSLNETQPKTRTTTVVEAETHSAWSKTKSKTRTTAGSARKKSKPQTRGVDKRRKKQ